MPPGLLSSRGERGFIQRLSTGPLASISATAQVDHMPPSGEGEAPANHWTSGGIWKSGPVQSVVHPGTHLRVQDHKPSNRYSPCEPAGSLQPAVSQIDRYCDGIRRSVECIFVAIYWVLQGVIRTRAGAVTQVSGGGLLLVVLMTFAAMEQGGQPVPVVARDIGLTAAQVTGSHLLSNLSPWREPAALQFCPCACSSHVGSAGVTMMPVTGDPLDAMVAVLSARAIGAAATLA